MASASDGKIKTIREKTFWEKYQPVKNHLDSNAAFDGCMFETFGEEFAFVTSQPTEKVWTYVQADNDEYIVTGVHLVNRLGYFVTKEPWTEDMQFKV